MEVIYGIDVSHHQGNIDWDRTSKELKRVNNNKNSGFAILRVGYSNRSGNGGLVFDKQIYANIAGCEKYGVPMGIYFYSYDKYSEACFTLNNTWGYTSANDTLTFYNNMNLETIFKDFILNSLSCGQNCLLNIGPDPYGEVPEM